MKYLEEPVLLVWKLYNVVQTISLSIVQS